MIVVTAATPWESGPLAGSLGLVPAGEGLFRGRAGGREILLVETGMGARSTEAALGRLGPERPEAVISSGLAGGLQAGVRAGDLVADVREAPLALARRARSLAEELGLPLHVGAILTEDRVVASPADKARLGRERRAAAVDMESSAVRAWARRRGAPFLVLRAVLDQVEERLPEGVPASSAWPDLARYAAARWRDLPLLLRLGRLRTKGLRALGLFLTRFLADIDPGAPDED